jgi:tRNA-intron endonuclease
MGGAY